MTLKLDWVNPKDLHPDQENPRRIEDEKLDQLKQSLVEYGFIQPVIFNKRTKEIVGGHQRVKAAINSGLKEVPVINVNWSKKKQKAANLALNKISGEWDYLKLEEYIQSIDLAESDPDDLSEYTTGFTDEDLKDIQQINLDDQDVEEDDFDADATAKGIKKPKTKLGDLYILDDKHRLLCGDSTKKEDVERLMSGKKADIVFTDPPYGVNYEGKTKDKLTIKNDTPEDLENFLSQVFDNLFLVLDGSYYICSQAGNKYKVFLNALDNTGLEVHQNLLWAKNTMVLGHGDYHYKHEPIIYGWKGKHYFTSDRTQTSVWEVNKPSRSEDHPTMKPLELPAKAIINSSKPSDIVLDVFLGSGTTLIAAEQLKRTCYGIEIDPMYCDVIIERYKKFKPDAKIKKVSS